MPRPHSTNSATENAFSRWRNVCDVLVVLSYMWCFVIRVVPTIYAMVATSAHHGQATSFPIMADSVKPSLKLSSFRCAHVNALGHKLPGNMSICGANDTHYEPEPTRNSITSRILIADCTFCTCPDSWSGWDCSKRWSNPQLLATLHKDPQVALRWFNHHWWWLTPYFAMRYSPLLNAVTMLLLLTILFVPLMVPAWWARGGRTLALSLLRLWTPIVALLQSKALAALDQPRLVDKLTPLSFIAQGLVFLGLALPVPFRHHVPLAAAEGGLLLLYTLQNHGQKTPPCASSPWYIHLPSGLAGVLLGMFGSLVGNALECEVVMHLQPSLVSSAGPYDVKAATLDAMRHMWWLLQVVGRLLLSAEGMSSLLMFVGYMVVSNSYDNPADMPLWLRALIL